MAALAAGAFPAAIAFTPGTAPVPVAPAAAFAAAGLKNAVIAVAAASGLRFATYACHMASVGAACASAVPCAAPTGFAPSELPPTAVAVVRAAAAPLPPAAAAAPYAAQARTAALASLSVKQSMTEVKPSAAVGGQPLLSCCLAMRNTTARLLSPCRHQGWTGDGWVVAGVSAWVQAVWYRFGVARMYRTPNASCSTHSPWSLTCGMAPQPPRSRTEPPHLHAAGVIRAGRHAASTRLGGNGQRHAVRRHVALGGKLQKGGPLAGVQVAPAASEPRNVMRTLQHDVCPDGCSHLAAPGVRIPGAKSPDRSPPSRPSAPPVDDAAGALSQGGAQRRNALLAFAGLALVYCVLWI